MSLAELFPQLQPLSREDKLVVMQFLQRELATEPLPYGMTEWGSFIESLDRFSSDFMDVREQPILDVREEW